MKSDASSWFQGLKKPSLTLQVFLGLVVGILLGVAVPDFAVQLSPLATIFLRMIKMLVAPLILATLVIGIAGAGEHGKMGSMGLKTLIYFEIVTTLALVIGLVVANVFQPGVGIPIDFSHPGNTPELLKLKESAAHISSNNFMDSLVHMFPTSVVEAMAKGDILQLVVFCVFFGLALGAAGEKGRPVYQFLQGLSEIMFKFVELVMAFAPMGVMAAIAATIGKNGLGVLVIFAKLVGALYFALGLFVLVVLVTVCALIRVPFLKMLQAIREPFLIAFSTAASEAALPRAMEQMERFGVPKRIVSFVMPTGYSFNLDGSTLYLSLATLFVAQMAGIHLPLDQQIMILLTLMLTSKGVAGVPRVSLVVLTATLIGFGLPVEGVAVILGVDHFLDMGRTSVNLVGNCVASAVIARWEGVFEDDKMHAFTGEEPSASTVEEPLPKTALLV